MRRPTIHSRFQRIAASTCRTAGAVALTALVLAPAASAHAVLEETTPAVGAVLPHAPARVVLHFSEPVETAFGSVRVFDEEVRRVDRGETLRPAPDEVAVALPSDLPPGTYTVAWRVVSADTHPVHGAFVFSVGRASGSGVVAQVLAGQATATSVDVAFAVVRFLSFALLLVAAGGAGMLAVVLPRSGTTRRRLWTVLAAAAGVLVPVSFAGIGLQAATASGTGLGGAFRQALVGEVLDTRFGKVWLARAALAALLAALALAARASSSGRDRRLAPFAAVLGGLLVVTPALAGHARVEGWPVVLLDAVHVAAAAVWTGGLLFLLLALLWATGERWAFAAAAVPRYSATAAGALAVLVVTGSANGFLEVRSFAALRDTTYGRLLLVKVALVLPLLALGLFNNRRSVPALRAGAATLVQRRRFLCATAAEIALFVAVLGITAVLVAEPPGKAMAAAQAGPFSTDTTVGPFDLNVVVDPARAGANQLHLYLLDRTTGQPVNVAEARIAASLPAAGIGPLRLQAVPAGPGHYVVPAATLPFPGAWKLRVDVRRGEFDEWSTTIPIPIKKGTPG